MIFWRFFNEEEKEEMGITDGESRDRESNNVVVDARGGNSHEAGGTRLAVLKLNLDRDWPCTRRDLVTVLLLENWRGAEFSKPSARRVSPDVFPLFAPLSPLSLPFRQRDHRSTANTLVSCF